MKKNSNVKKIICNFCKGKEKILVINNEINEIIFKTNLSNTQSKIYEEYKNIINKTENKDKLFYICENCLNDSMNYHFFGIEKIKKEKEEKNINYDFIENYNNANMSFLQLLETYKILNRQITVLNFQIYHATTILFDFINQNSKVLFDLFGNDTFIFFIEKLYSLIGNLKEYTDSNKNSKITEKKIINDILLFFDEIFGRIHSYKMLNNTEKEIHPYLNFLIFQSLNNDFIITEYKKKFFEELNKGNSQFKK